MTRLVWDQKAYEVGLDRGVFYPPIGSGEAWNGLTAVIEDTVNADEQARYIDGVLTRRRRRLGYFSGTIEALTYPWRFYSDILTQRRQKAFGLSYRVKDKIHLVYNATVPPATLLYSQSETTPFGWSFDCLPVPVPGGARTAHIIIDTSIAYPWTTEALEDVLYGTEATPPRLPLPEEVLDIFEENSILQIIDHGDGSWTAIGPDEAIQMLDATTFEITWPSAVYIDAVSYTIHSL